MPPQLLMFASPRLTRQIAKPDPAWGSGLKKVWVILTDPQHAQSTRECPMWCWLK